jgi:NAD(P)-dependent dehydrogenase (short-subunit alcohol dehydrogenase family)
VVTGATSGFGEAAVHHFAASGRDVVLVARSRDRAERVRAEVTAEHPVATLETVLADLSSAAAVERAAAEVRGLARPIAVLLNNAGAIFGFRRRESVDGIELTMALNHFAYQHLTVRLLDLVEAAAPSRIVNVASNAYENAKGRFDFDDWQAERRYNPLRQYGRSKLANILFTRELADRTEGTGVDVVAWSPRGLTATRFAYGANPLAPLAMKLMHPFAAKTEREVVSLFDLCDRPLAPAERGAFFVGDTIDPVPVAPPEDAHRLWALTEQVLAAS